MAASAQFTVTATTGPGRDVTAKVFQGIKAFFVDVEKQMLFLYPQNDDVTGPILQFALTSTVTFTATISNGNWTVVVSAT